MSGAKLWDAYMRSYGFLTQVDGYAQNIRDIAARAGVHAGTRVLDAGSGTGNLSLVLKTQGAQVASCDFSVPALRQHRAKDLGAVLVHASLEDPLPFAEGDFDAVCCASVLFALSEQGCRLALREFFRVLGPAGRLVVTVPAREARLGALVRMHAQSMRRRHGAFLGPLRAAVQWPALLRVLYYNRKLFRLPDWQGFHRFTETELGGWIEAAGFERVQTSRTYGGCFILSTASKPAACGRTFERQDAPALEREEAFWVRR